MSSPPVPLISTIGNAPAGARTGITATGRIETLDVLRGVAICGILLMNIYTMGGTSTYPLTHFPASWNVEWITWGAQTLFVQGAMRGLFTLLFGAGMVLMLRRVERDGQAAPIDIWVRRSIGLMLLGIAQFALFLWPGEILWTYGVSAFFLLPFRTAKVRTLLIAAGVLIAGLSAYSAYRDAADVAQLQAGRRAIAAAAQGQPLAADARAAAAAETRYLATIHPLPADRAAAIDQRTHAPSLLKWSLDLWATENLTATGWASVVESLAFMLIGMALFRWGVLTGDAAPSTYRRLMLVGYGGGLAWRAVPVVLAARTGWDMGSPLVSPVAWTMASAMFQPARLLVTLGHVGLVVTMWRSGWLGRARTLRTMGRMTLSLYCLQSILASLLFYGFGLFGLFSLAQLWGIAVGIWIVTAAFSHWWLARHPMGPAETFLRRFAHGELTLPRFAARLLTGPAAPARS